MAASSSSFTGVSNLFLLCLEVRLPVSFIVICLARPLSWLISYILWQQHLGSCTLRGRGVTVTAVAQFNFQSVLYVLTWYWYLSNTYVAPQLFSQSMRQ